MAFSCPCQLKQFQVLDFFPPDPEAAIGVLEVSILVGDELSIIGVYGHCAREEDVAGFWIARSVRRHAIRRALAEEPGDVFAFASPDARNTYRLSAPEEVPGSWLRCGPDDDLSPAPTLVL